MPRSSSSDGGALGQPSDGPSLPAAFGRYQVKRLIGEGAMGRVLLAHDPVLDREVALKHLRDDLCIPREARDALVVRMRHEARAAARVMHPNLVTLHDMGEDPELGLYLVFEYVEGPTLKQRLLEGPLSAAQAARLARELGEGLTLAHRAGIVHRDVKPENIILAASGGKVADFGIARIPDSTLTHQGGLMGTPAYSAPETFRVSRFSPESDQFSLAAVMYEAISGRRAFPGDDAVSVAAKIAHENPVPIAAALGLPPPLDEVLARGLAKRPEDRYPSCEAFGAAFAASLGTVSRPVSEATAQHAQAFVSPAGPLFPAPTEARDSDLLPRERKIGQVILGAAVVVATAALLIRTALRTSDAPEHAPEDPASSTSSPTMPPTPHRPSATVRPARPRLDAPDTAAPEPREPEAITQPPDASATSAADAGTPEAGSTSAPSADPGEDDAPQNSDAGPPGPADADMQNEDAH